jgi:outer membrane protein OmpA-like peptidoglycan-associated protein
MKALRLIAAASLGGLLAACAAETPRELKDARVAYQHAAQSPGAGLAASDVDQANRALDRAERAYGDQGNEPEVRDLAYVAERRAVLAESRGNTALSMRQQQQALAEIDHLKQQHAMAANRELGREKQRQEQMESERQARQAALAKIAGLKTTEDARGTVLTVSGNVLFATGQAELLPTARKRLAEVATVLKDGKQRLTIVGHTDSTGRDDRNQTLSRRRADTVRKYLIAQGVAADRIQGQGVGANEPIDDNKTPEGRAANRRVEIILNVEPSAPAQ